MAAASALFVFFWASGFVAAKFGLPYAEPFTFLTIRFLVALAVLVPLAILWRADWPSSYAVVGHVIVAGLLIQTIYLIGVFYAVYLGISTGVIALIVGLQPLITGALAAPVLGENVTLRQFVGLALGFVGLGLVVAEKIDPASGQAWALPWAQSLLPLSRLGHYIKSGFVGPSIFARPLPFRTAYPVF